MTESEAREELEADTEASSEPLLDSTDVDAFLSASVISAPTSSGASDGEWNLSRAKGRAWRRKQGRAAQFHGIESQIYQHCKEMALHWEGQASGVEPSSLPPTMSVATRVRWG